MREFPPLSRFFVKMQRFHGGLIARWDQWFKTNCINFDLGYENRVVMWVFWVIIRQLLFHPGDWRIAKNLGWKWWDHRLKLSHRWIVITSYHNTKLEYTYPHENKKDVREETTTNKKNTETRFLYYFLQKWVRECLP